MVMFTRHFQAKGIDEYNGTIKGTNTFPGEDEKFVWKVFAAIHDGEAVTRSILEKTLSLMDQHD